ncbi:dual adapter for phosphotyrosine and 3-phosphotyrosine and 3-phosphoinositide-like [Hydractinia symbiolongicarpus]|uniref:dual adapter for phosphotyrosine and 3-phosphotyrosine and 3-phosphoinositide-like n=1 Tax=Hydractinia symbiolongicarpus TaxID=13093 RepID=UPI00254FDD11|nr:dual adapter for phosphotyrosine and 3-phosphotyrosine and 3-phosphoinositide-like [Hydractinia symbiolongicarpus]
MADRIMYRINTEGILEDCSDDECQTSDDDDVTADSAFRIAKKPIERLEELPWFHDNMTRNTAEALLLANGVEGTYLLRRSKNNPGMYTVSVRCKDSLKHFALEYNLYTNTYSFGMGKFDTLYELLEHFNCMPMLGGDSGSSVTLQYPYMNDIPEPSSYEKVTRHAEYGKRISVEKKSEPPPDLHIASKEGYLVKRGAIHKNWKKRWFVLQKNLLKYYSDRKDHTPIRSINLSEAEQVSEDFCDNKRNCFRLVLPSRTFYFVAGSPEEIKSWVEILQWKIDYYKGRKDDNQTPTLRSSIDSANAVGSHVAYLAQYTKV